MIMESQIQLASLLVMIFFTLCHAVTQKCSLKESRADYFCVCDALDGINGWSYTCIDDTNLEAAFSVKYVVGHSVTFQCGMEEPHYKSVLRQLDLDEIRIYAFKSCPLPSEPYDEILPSNDQYPVEQIKVEKTKGNRSLSEEMFGNITGTLKSLILNNNGMESVSESLFSNFTHLQYLSLSDNRLKALPENVFVDLRNLTTLEITNNFLESLPVDIFQSQDLLEKLYLYKNKLRELPDGLFKNLVNLKTLDLADNQLILLPNHIFSQLSHIVSIRLRANWLGTIPEDLFRNCTTIQVVDLSLNRFMEPLPEDLFYGLSQLENISIHDCNLTLIREGFFSHNSNMTHLNMEENSLSSLPKKIFQNNSKVKEININFNLLQELPAGLFPNQMKLEKLSLFRNNLSVIPDRLFKRARNIKTLVLGRNQIRNASDTIFQDLPELEVLDLSVNNLTYFKLDLNENIKRLDLSYNSLSKMPSINWIQHLLLEKVNLEHNNIEYLEIPWLHSSNNPVINIANNKIKTVSVNNVLINDLGIKSEQGSENYNNFVETRIILNSNPFICDCRLFSFYNYMKHSSGSPKSVRFDNIQDLTCQNPHIYTNQKIISLTPNQFTCDIQQDCSAPCHCYLRAFDSSNIVNCSNHKLKVLPELVPWNTSVLHFQNNVLTRMDAFNQDRWENLTSIFLDNNFISNLDNWTVPHMLSDISLRGNKLRHLPSSFMDFVSNAKAFHLTLSDNPWICNCSSMNFKKWLTDHYKLIDDVQKIMCGNRLKWNNTLIRSPILTAPDDILCPTDNWPDKVHLITVSVICVVLALLLFIVIVLYYRNKQTVIAYVYIHMHHVFTCFFSEDDMDEDKIFDAFVSYSSSDRDVAMSLIEELEKKEPRFNLCIHERNWIAGNQISWNIFNSVHNSKRTILVISKAFLESMWFQVEFHTAYYQMLEDKIDRLIIIVKGELPPKENMDRDLQYLLSTKTYLIWEEKWFWEKLKYAMPHKKQLLPNDVLALKDRPDREKIKPVENQIAILSSSDNKTKGKVHDILQNRTNSSLRLVKSETIDNK